VKFKQPAVEGRTAHAAENGFVNESATVAVAYVAPIATQEEEVNPFTVNTDAVPNTVVQYVSLYVVTVSVLPFNKAFLAEPFSKGVHVPTEPVLVPTHVEQVESEKKSRTAV
jgi:hypothetical protein